MGKGVYTQVQVPVVARGKWISSVITGGCETSGCNEGDSANQTTGLFKSSLH